MGVSTLEAVAAMGFYHRDGFVPAWQQASRFAGEGGRVATLPDIIEARLATEPGSAPWEQYYTSASAEYLGYSRNGTRIIIVAHGIGPMSALDGILKAYSYEYRDKKRDRRGGRITEEEWQRLQDGEYGKVEVVEFDPILDRYEYAFIQMLRASEALAEPLLRARFGPRAAEYIEQHAAHARQWHSEQAGIDPENTYNLPEREAFLARRREKHLWGAAVTSDPYILEMGAAPNCLYAHRDDDGGRILTPTIEPGEGAIAHLLSISRLAHVCHEGNESLACDFDCHEWWNGTRLVGVRAGMEISDIHPGFDTSNVLQRHWRSLMQTVATPPKVGFRALMRLDDGTYFTQYPKQGASLDKGAPEFLVTSMERIGDPVTFSTEIHGYYGLFRYEIRDVRSIAPPGANAYKLAGKVEDVWEGGNPVRHEVPVQFYRVTVDSSHRLIRDDQLRNDYERLMSLIGEEVDD